MGNEPEYVVQFSVTCTLCRQPAGLCKLAQLQSHSFPAPLPCKKKRILDNFYRSNASTELDQRPSTVLLGCVSLAVTHLLTLARTNMGSNHQLQPECLSPQPMQQLLFRTLLPKKTFGLELFLKHFIMKFSHSESDCSIV